MKLIIFDMDGTLTDSWPGMQYCYNKTFQEYGRGDMTEDEFKTRINFLHDRLRLPFLPEDVGDVVARHFLCALSKFLFRIDRHSEKFPRFYDCVFAILSRSR